MIMYNANMIFDERLKQLRDEIGLSQNQLAKKLGMHDRHISLLERGGSKPGIDTLKKISEIFGVSTDYLIFDNAPRQSTIKLADTELLDLFYSLDKLNDPQSNNLVKELIKSVIFKTKIQNATK